MAARHSTRGRPAGRSRVSSPMVRMRFVRDYRMRDESRVLHRVGSVVEFAEREALRLERQWIAERVV